MLDIVQLPLARRLWRVSKFYSLPLNDQRIQDLDPYDLEFIEYSMIADDPKQLNKLKNYYFDPDFDEWLEEFDEEQKAKEKAKESQNEDRQYGEKYEEVTADTETIDDWEEDNG